MAAAAHNPQFAAKVGIPVGVAQDFNQADKGTEQLRQSMMNRNSMKKKPPPQFKK
jgi:hypothetical protein